MLYENGESKVDDIAEVLGISRVTCYRYIDIAKKEGSKHRQVKSLYLERGVIRVININFIRHSPQHKKHTWQIIA